MAVKHLIVVLHLQVGWLSALFSEVARENLFGGQIYYEFDSDNYFACFALGADHS